MAPKVPLGALIRVTAPTKNNASERLWIVRIEVDETGAQVLARNRIELCGVDTERIKDVQLHVLPEGVTRDALDNAASPVEAGAIHPAFAGMEGERVAEGFLDGAALAFLQRGEFFVSLRDEGVDEVVDKAGAMCE